MGLILGVRRDEKIYVGDDWFRVTVVTGPKDFVVENADGSAYSVEGEGHPPQEVIPEVLISAGKLRSEAPANQARVFIEAPRDMLILRQGPYSSLCLHEDAADMIEQLMTELREGRPLEAGHEDDAKGVLKGLDEEIKRLTRGG